MDVQVNQEMLSKYFPEIAFWQDFSWEYNTTSVIKCMYRWGPDEPLMQEFLDISVALSIERLGIPRKPKNTVEFPLKAPTFKVVKQLDDQNPMMQ